MIELLVVVGIVGIVGTMVANLFLSNLRTAAKTKALVEIKQNGDYALSVMERMIRNSREITPCPASETSLTILNPDGQTTIFDCSGEKIASNSSSLVGANMKVKGCSLICEKAEANPAVVTINFILSQKGVSLGKEFTAESPFQITVSTRTY